MWSAERGSSGIGGPDDVNGQGEIRPPAYLDIAQRGAFLFGDNVWQSMQTGALDSPFCQRSTELMTNVPDFRNVH